MYTNEQAAFNPAIETLSFTKHGQIARQAIHSFISEEKQKD
jgi:hypothetical protein